MKSIGGRVRQIASIYLTTVVIFGMLSLLIALPVGVIGARLFADFAASLANYDIDNFTVQPYVLAMQTGLALLMPLVVSLRPVLRGVRIPAREALGDYGIQRSNQRDAVDRLIEQVQGPPTPDATIVAQHLPAQGASVADIDHHGPSRERFSLRF